MSVHELAAATAACGGKALGLARLVAAGLPVPDGFVLDDGVFRAIAGDLDPADTAAIGHLLAHAADRIATAELPAEVVQDVITRAATLGTVIVRSSATIEDGEAGAGAGVFSSRDAVPAADVWPAIRAVWTSALTPLAAAYARRRGGRISIGVIVQRFVPGERITVYTRAPGKPGGDAMIQRGGEVTVVPRSSTDPALVLALRAEAAIGANSGADVELVHATRGETAIGATGENRELGIALVQARPIVHPVVKPRAAAPPALLAALVADGRAWTWDVAHNPDPLSPAQAELVERFERAAIAPYRLRVCAGYLYSAPRGEVPLTAAATSRAELAARAGEIETRLAEALGMEVPPLDEAITRYLAFYGIWAGELGPLITATRAGLTAAQLAGARPSAVEATLFGAARGDIEEATALAHLGVLAPAWDIAVATYGERPGVLRDAIARARIVDRDRTLVQLTGSVASERTSSTDEDSREVAQVSGSVAGDVARAAADLAERDDHWFARAQLLVRKSVIARADELGLDPDDAFWIPLEDLEQNHLDPDDVRRRASAARNAAARASQWAMPRTVGGPVESPAIALRGLGTGSRVTGRIVRLATLASTVAISSGDIVVARAVTPALAIAVIGCAALVSETGGLLDHGAALARELGIPCVVGCHDAWSLLTDGMVVTVDGDAGSVEIAS
jgi:phosphohistidine swiveling domain-containing protein